MAPSPNWGGEGSDPPLNGGGCHTPVYIYRPLSNHIKERCNSINFLTFIFPNVFKKNHGKKGFSTILENAILDSKHINVLQIGT